MTTAPTAAEAWSSAPWEQAAHMLAPIHLHLAEGLAPQPGERWLDLATGTGAVAFLAARGGAETTGVDFAPRLIETARSSAADFAVGPLKALAESLELDERERCHQDFLRYIESFGDEGVPGDYVPVLGTKP